MIQAYVEKGAYLIAIAGPLGVHPRTVRRALQRGGPPSGQRPQVRHRTLEPDQPGGDRRLQEGGWHAVVIWRESAALGYTGRSRLLRAYIRPTRALRPSRSTVRCETAPGQQLQHDWAAVWTGVAGERQQVYVAVNTLGYSRRFQAWAAPRADAEHTDERLMRAFEGCGGAPREVLVDKQKAAVIEHRLGDRVRSHPRFWDRAGPSGFRPHACRPYRARPTGQDARMGRSRKEPCFVGYRAFDRLTPLHQPLQHGFVSEADRRVHGTGKEGVGVRFQREQPPRQPVPVHRFDPSYREPRVVAWEGDGEVRGNRYSVPAARCGQSVPVRLTLEGPGSSWDRQGQGGAVQPYRPAAQGGRTSPPPQAGLWPPAGGVERRD